MVVLAEPPARDVELMRPLVARVAVAEVPVPVPVVVEAVGIERPLRRRPEPEVVVHPLGHGAVLFPANRLAVAGNPRLDKRHLTELAGPHELVGAGEVGGAPA